MNELTAEWLAEHVPCDAASLYLLDRYGAPPYPLTETAARLCLYTDWVRWIAANQISDLDPPQRGPALAMFTELHEQWAAEQRIVAAKYNATPASWDEREAQDQKREAAYRAVNADYRAALVRLIEKLPPHEGTDETGAAAP